jgi:dihydropyrimidinase
VGEALVVFGGRVVIPSGSFAGDVLVRDGKVVAVGRPGSWGRGGIDARGQYVLAGGVDPHAHLLSDVPAADAALRGGTTTVLSFTWPRPGEDPVEAFVRARDQELPATSLDTGIHAAFWEPETVTPEQIRELHRLGVCGLKLYVAYPELGIMASDRRVYEIMKAGAELGLPTQVHAESGDLIAALIDEALAAGNIAAKYFALTRPPATEEESVYCVLRIAELAGADAYLVHLTTAGALEHVRAARRRGQRVWAEVCSWSLTLDDSVLEHPDPQRYLTAPPPRSRDHVEALWQGVRDGTVDALASDHHQHQYPPPPQPDFRGLAFGIRGLEPRVSLLLSEGLAARDPDRTAHRPSGTAPRARVWSPSQRREPNPGPTPT